MALLDLEKDIIHEINMKHSIISYDLPYVLTTDLMESLKNLIENAPTAYSFNIEESPCYPSGIFLLLECLE